MCRARSLNALVEPLGSANSFLARCFSLTIYFRPITCESAAITTVVGTLRHRRSIESSGKVRCSCLDLVTELTCSVSTLSSEKQYPGKNILLRHRTDYSASLSWMVSPLWSQDLVGGVPETSFLVKQSPTGAMCPSSSRRDWLLAPRATSAPARRSRSCQVVGGLLGPGSPYSRSTTMLVPMNQCEIQTCQVSGQEPSLLKMISLAGRRLRLVFFNNQTSETRSFRIELG